MTLYTSSSDNSTLAVLLGATSFSDLLDHVETANATAQQDARIVRQVTEAKRAIQRHRVELENAEAGQQHVVADRTAQRHTIESQLAQRHQLLSSIRDEIARMRPPRRRSSDGSLPRHERGSRARRHRPRPMSRSAPPRPRPKAPRSRRRTRTAALSAPR